MEEPHTSQILRDPVGCVLRQPDHLTWHFTGVCQLRDLAQTLGGAFSTQVVLTLFIVGKLSSEIALSVPAQRLRLRLGKILAGCTWTLREWAINTFDLAH
jgi:hypothetical protein